MHVLHITNHILERFHTCQIHKSPVFVPLLAAWIWPTKPRSLAGAPHLQAHPSRRSKSIPAKRSYPLLNMAVRCHSKSLSLSKSRWTIFQGWFLYVWQRWIRNGMGGDNPEYINKQQRFSTLLTWPTEHWGMDIQSIQKIGQRGTDHRFVNRHPVWWLVTQLF